MTEAIVFEGKNGDGDIDQATLRRIRFVAQAGGGDSVLMSFADPFPRQALMAASKWKGPLTAAAGSEGDAVDILTVPHPPDDNPRLREELSNWVQESSLAGVATPIGTVFHGAQVFWRPGRAAILAAPDRLELLLLALVDFNYYESELRKLEKEVAAAWPELEADSHLAHEVKLADLERREVLGDRMGHALQRRMRYARLEPHLHRASAHLSLQAQELGARLREKSRVEERLEALCGQLELFDHVYEMASQKLSEYRASRQELKLELIIIVLLAAETVMLLLSLYH